MPISGGALGAFPDVLSGLLVQMDLSGTTFGGAPTWTDVTRFVRLVDGVSITSWRQDALTQISPSTLNLTLDNEALPGDATAPNAGRFTPGLSTSPWTGKIIPGVRCRVSETVGGVVYPLIDCYALDWTAQPGGGDDGTFPVVAANFTDALGWMGQLQPLYAIVLEEMLLDAPASLYPLDDPSGAATAGDLTGKSTIGRITRAKGGSSTSTYAFGTAVPFVGLPGGLNLTSPDAGNASSFAHCFYLSVPNVLPASGTGWTITVAFVGPTSNASSTFDETIWGIGSQDDTNGIALLSVLAGTGVPSFLCTNGVTANAIGVGLNVCDGKPHVISCSLSVDGKTATMIVDGVVFTGTAAQSAGPVSRQPLIVGCRVFSGGNAGYPFAGTFNLIAQYGSVLSTARATAHYTAAMTAFAGERTDVHAARLLGYRPNTGGLLDVGKGTVGLHDTAGQTLSQALLATGDAEGGLVYADGQGRIVLLNRARLYDPTSTASLDVEADLTSDFQARIDTQLLVNDMTVSRAASADQRVLDRASKSTYGWRQQSATLIVNSDRDAADAAGWAVANQKTASVRTPTLTADLATMTSTSQAQAVIARQPLDRVTLANLPSWAPPTDVMIQGRTIRIDDKAVSVSFFASTLPRKTLRADGVASANTKLDNGLVIPR